MTISTTTFFSAIASALLWPSLAVAWGFDGHRRLAAHVQDPLPVGSCLRQFIAANQSSAFQDRAPDPDRWRSPSHANYDPGEWYRHYLEVDWAGPIEAYPREWAEVQRVFGQYAERNGTVPWRTEEYDGLLAAAFSSKDVPRILATLAHYSHYLTDAFSLLHDTKNFDPNGLHGRWESDLLSNQTYLNGIAQLAVSQYLGVLGRAHPRHAVFDIVLEGNRRAPELISADVATTRPDGGHDMAAFYGQVKDLTARRWGDALTLFASLVATAWLDAGAPLLPGMNAGCSTAIAEGEVVLRGYPVSWTPVPDGGPEDAGTTPETDGGTDAGGGNEDGGSDADPPLEGCGCGGAGVPALVWLLPLFGLVAQKVRARR